MLILPVLLLILIMSIIHKIRLRAILSPKITEVALPSLITTETLDLVDIANKLTLMDSLMKIAKVPPTWSSELIIKANISMNFSELCFFPRCNFNNNSQRRQCYQCSVTYDSEGNVMGSGDADCMKTMDPTLE